MSEVAPRYDLTPKKPHFEPQAKAMISLFMMGGPSQMDLFDPKPMLTKYDGQKFPGEIKYDNLAQASAKVFGSPWKFSPRGQCGMELSELLPGLAEVADEITLIRSMQSGVSNHAQGLYAINNGRIVAGRPTARLVAHLRPRQRVAGTARLHGARASGRPADLPGRALTPTAGCPRSTRAR